MNEIITIIHENEIINVYNRLAEPIKTKFLDIYPKYAEKFPFDIVNFAKDMGIDIIEFGIVNGSSFSEKKQRFSLNFRGNINQTTYEDYISITRSVLCIICNSKHLELCGNIVKWGVKNNQTALPQKLLPAILTPTEQFLKMNELLKGDTKKLAKYFGVSDVFIEKRKSNLI